MTAEYTLLETPSSKNMPKKRWVFVFVGIVLSTVLFYLVYFVHLNSIDRGLVEPLPSAEPKTPQQIPIRNINVSVSSQEDPYYIDLDKYPIEDNMAKLFPNTVEAIRTAAASKLLNKSLSWTDQWLNHTAHTTRDTFSCSVQPLPFPILRHIVAEYSLLQDTDDFFEDASLNMTEPFVLLPFKDRPVLNKGDTLCIRIIVPYQPMDTDDPHTFQYRPYPENNRELTYPWWDTMMSWLQDINTNATLPLKINPWSGHKELRAMSRRLNRVSDNLPEWARLREDEFYERSRVHVYEAQVTLPHAGEYKLSALLEFVQAKYNFEYGPVTPYQPVDLPIVPSKAHLVVGERREDMLKEHLKLPLCTRSDHPGRWLPWPESQDRSKVLGVSRSGKYWAPYECRYRYLTYERFNRCVAQRYGHGIDVYGDSNMRRSLKKFVSHGQWCKDWQDHIAEPLVPSEMLPVLAKRQSAYTSPRNYTYLVPEQTRSCYCEDYTEPYWNSQWFDGGGRRVNVEMNNTRQESLELGSTEWDDPKVHNVLDAFNISSYKWDGLTYLNNPPWQLAIEGNTVNTDIAVFSLGNWDSAFLELEPYLKDVDVLIEQIKGHYDLNKTRIIYRTPQYYCCRVDHSFRDRQVSGPRLDVFDEQVRTRFIKELNATVWDTKVLGEARTWEEKLESINCPSNHVAADLVEIENQVFMNGLCNE